MIRFEDLPDSDKVQQIINNAAFITSINQHHSVAKLYSLSGLFIEIQFNPSMEEIHVIRVLTGEDLNCYLDRITIGDIFKL